MSLFTIKQILKDHWSSFSSIYAEKIRPVVSYEVNKVINCGDLSNGFTTYMCPSCHRIKLVPFRCHSRFCNTCGVAYQLDRSANISAKLFKCKHRHVVFTIPEQLREYFRKDRSILHVLFHSAAQVISFWANSLNKKKTFPSAWSLDFILLAVTSNGIHISTCFFLKVLSETILLGVSFHIFLLSISEKLG